ncbi:hypothetical protein [Arthrobacter sp. Bz4]|uniref:hypothetical protein n=1 Tax=Arthrobacter sp. Bz4 TaxID=2171979 RepID=UPI000D523B00|nr:hypothetical protein [Arthrobacter sp. Bz4]PVE15651.1 hypothetical protein DDA93_14160 [Arthrobacter sp. Bz4]
MATNQPGDQLLYELRAREAWSQRDYERARVIAGQAVDLAREDNNEVAWWNMAFLQAECLREEGAVQESVLVAQQLRDHPLTSQSPSLAVRVLTLLAVGLQGLGQLPEAVRQAAAAVEVATGAVDAPELRVEAHQALIASLAESDRLDEAWAQCLALSVLLSTEMRSQTAGKAHWAIGNVAFMRHEVADGTKFHSLAAGNLSPNNDLDLWARFNRASAALRLAAGVVDAETLECIERAETASSIVGGNDRDQLELSLTRAHWLVLTGQLNAAVKRLKPICADSTILASQTAGEANLLLGRALAGRGDDIEAMNYLDAAKANFIQSGAHDRAAHVAELIESLMQPESTTT